MARYTMNIEAFVTDVEVEADSKEEAIEKAFEEVRKEQSIMDELRLIPGTLVNLDNKMIEG